MPTIAMEKTIALRRITTIAGAVGFAVCFATAAAMAAPPQHHGPGGGGGGPHPGGGVAHFNPHPGGGGGGVPHFAHVGGGVPHFAHVGGGGPHVAHVGGRSFHSFHGPVGHAHAAFGRAHVAHSGRPSFRGRQHGPSAGALAHQHGPAAAAIAHQNLHGGPNGAHAVAATQRGITDPHNFAAHRHFADNGAFRPFLDGRWHRHGHLGWVGPLFWPYAYGDFFYYALWPYEYDDYDPFWAYGYGDIYEGIFSPFNYDEYVQGSGAPARMTALTQGVAQSCANEAAEVTDWPINQIQDAVKPNQQQSALLDDLGNAVVKASDLIKSHCPTAVSFTPVGRLADMQQRLEGMVQAVGIISPPLGKFYDALSDEQKARFNDIGAPSGGQNAPPAAAANAANPQAQCTSNVSAWPTEQIDHVVRPTTAQRAKLDALQAAASQAADIIKAACPSAPPSTPPDRLAAVGKHLNAMLQAVRTIGPVLTDFYNSLSDSQKARFNTLGQQLFAANAG